jgi:hypothetical protein
MDICPIFHILLLDPIHNNPLLGQLPLLPEYIIVKGKHKYELEDILDSHIFRYQLEYLIKWHGWDVLTWEHMTEVNKLKAINNFYT